MEFDWKVLLLIVGVLHTVIVSIKTIKWSYRYNRSTSKTFYWFNFFEECNMGRPNSRLQFFLGTFLSPFCIILGICAIIILLFGVAIVVVIESLE